MPGKTTTQSFRRKSKSLRPNTLQASKSSSGATQNDTGAQPSPSSSAAPPKSGRHGRKSSLPSSASSPSSSELKLVELVRSWIASLPDYCRTALKIRTKSGAITALTLNTAQVHLHDRLEEQKRRTGRVRALVLKGRQQGVSTYLQARFFWLTSLNRGLRAQILTHRQDATEHIFGMAERFVRECQLAPKLGASNAKELHFSELDSGYQVATAGAKAVGRSMTCQLFHGSEVAFWDSAEDHLAGIGQIVPDLPGTEIILESTANGVGNLFCRMWQDAESGKSDYLPVFIPWFWDSGYARDASGFVPDSEEAKLAEAYGLTPEQLTWRRWKIVNDFNGDLNRFRQEYPCCASEAFVLVGHESFIPLPLVTAAVASRTGSGQGPLIIGVDPARFGDDATAIAKRRGRVCSEVIRYWKRSTMEVAGTIAQLIRTDKPVRVFLDIGGLGAGIYDRLLELGFGHVVSAVNFGEGAWARERWRNRRAEMWGEMRAWLAAPPVSIPGDLGLQSDLIGPMYTYDSEGRVKLESKDDMRKRKVKSPDAGDALALTFAAPVGGLDSGLSSAQQAWDRLDDAAHTVLAEGLPWAHTG